MIYSNLTSIINFLKRQELEGAAAIVTIIGVPILFIKLLVIKAKHKIGFDPKRTYDKVRLVNQSGQPWSIWLHVLVKNKGFELSRDTEGYLAEIWLKGPPPTPLKMFKASVKLKWAHEATIAPIDIFPRETRRLDVCYVFKNNKDLHIEAEGFPSGTIKNVLPPGDYIFTIKVVSKNALSPAEFLLDLKWNGRWNTLEGKPYVRSFRLYRKPVRSFKMY